MTVGVENVRLSSEVVCPPDVATDWIVTSVDWAVPAFWSAKAQTGALSDAATMRPAVTTAQRLLSLARFFI